MKLQQKIKQWADYKISLESLDKDELLRFLSKEASILTYNTRNYKIYDILMDKYINKFSLEKLTTKYNITVDGIRVLNNIAFRFWCNEDFNLPDNFDDLNLKDKLYYWVYYYRYLNSLEQLIDEYLDNPRIFQSILLLISKFKSNNFIKIKEFDKFLYARDVHSIVHYKLVKSKPWWEVCGIVKLSPTICRNKLQDALGFTDFKFGKRIINVSRF